MRTRILPSAAVPSFAAFSPAFSLVPPPQLLFLSVLWSRKRERRGKVIHTLLVIIKDMNFYNA
jgi:hypothetical protein